MILDEVISYRVKNTKKDIPKARIRVVWDRFRRRCRRYPPRTFNLKT